MKRCFSFLTIQILTLVCASCIFAQSNWNFANPRPQGGDLYGVTIKKDSLAIMAGANGVTLRRVGGTFTTPIFVGTQRLLSASHYLDTVWATGDSATILRSVDNGINWTSKSISGTSVSFWSAAPYSALRIVVVGDSGFAYLTTNGGTSWTKEANTTHIRMNAVKLDGFTAYAVGASGTLFVGNNMGEYGWISETIVTGQSLNDLSLTHDDMWVVGDNGYVQHRSTVGNALIWDTTFTSIGQPLKSVVFTGQYIVAVGGGGTVLRSSDGGSTWTLPSSGTTEDLYHLDTTADVNHLGTLLAVGKKGVILRSTNYGQTWIRLDTGSRSQVLAMAQSPNGNYFGSSNLGGLFSSIDQGLTWRRDSITGSFNQLTDIQFGSSGFGVMATSGAGVLVSSDSGHTWTSKVIAGTTILGVAITNDVIGIAVGANGAIYRSINKGSTWTLVSSPVVKTFYDVDMYGKNGVIVGYGGVSLYTKDAGVTWAVGSSAATAQLNRVRMTTATNAVAVGVVGNIWRTVDGGQHWSSVTSPTNLTLRDVAFHDDVNGMIVGDAGVILKTSNGGTSWTADVSHTDQNLYAAMITSGTTAFAGGERGTILTTSNSLLPVELVSLTASRISNHSVVINWSVVAQSDNAGFLIERENASDDFEEIGWKPASTPNAGQASFSFEDLNANDAATTYRLKQRDLNGTTHDLGNVTVEGWNGSQVEEGIHLYPNPAADHLFVTLSGAPSSDAKIILYDMLGRELINSASIEKQGPHLCRMDVSGLPAGTYRCVILSANVRREQSLVIVR